MDDIAELPEDRAVWIDGYGQSTIGEIRALRAEFITTEKAEEIFSYRRNTWAAWARDGLIDGARYDRVWRLPLVACRAHLGRITKPRRRPRAKTSQAERAWPSAIPRR